jgi:hypothetical protein
MKQNQEPILRSIYSYNAIAVKICTATSSLVRFEFHGKNVSQIDQPSTVFFVLRNWTLSLNQKIPFSQIIALVSANGSHGPAA